MQKVRIILALVALTLVISLPSYAEEWAITFSGGGSKERGAHSVQQTADGGYVVAGYVAGFFGAGGRDFWVLKLDAGGTIEWQNTYGGESLDEAKSIQQTTDGGYIVAGHTWSFGSNIWVLKLNPDGSVAWQKNYGGDDSEYGCCIHQTTDRGYIVAGRTRSFGAGHNDAWVLKLDSGGDIEWQRTYGTEEWDQAKCIQQTMDDGYILLGDYRINDDDDIWVLKIDGEGDIEWQKSYGVEWPIGTYFVQGSSIQQTTDGGYIVAGFTEHDEAALVLKLDGAGNIEWQKTYGKETFYWQPAPSVRQTIDGGYVVATGHWTNHGDALVLKVDSDGDIQWQKAYVGRGEDQLRAVEQTTDGGYVLAGDTESFGAEDQRFWWVFKINSEGEIPYCTAMRDTNVTASSGELVAASANAVTQASSAIPGVTTVSPKETSAKTMMICPTTPEITEHLPTHGGYGAKMKVRGSGFGKARQKRVNANDGYYGFITFSGQPGTMIATKYLELQDLDKEWSWDKIKVKFNGLFIDQDGDHLQDEDEPFLTPVQLPLGNYALKVNTIWFHDLYRNGVYDEGDEVYDIVSSNSETFNLTDEPVIYTLIPNPAHASAPGSPQKVKIKGLNFGDTQGASTLHVGDRSWSEEHPKIRLWQNDKIKFKVPSYSAPFPKYKEVWVTVNGGNSNKVMLKIWAP